MTPPDVPRFVDDLPPGTQKRVGDEFYDTLRAHPGRWAEFKTYPSANGAYARARVVGEQHPDIERSVRRTGDRAWTLYLRAAEQ